MGPVREPQGTAIPSVAHPRAARVLRSGKGLPSRSSGRLLGRHRTRADRLDARPDRDLRLWILTHWLDALHWSTDLMPDEHRAPDRAR
jgi:hypothetical protein